MRRQGSRGRRTTAAAVAVFAATSILTGCSLFTREEAYSYDIFTEGLVQPPTANLTPGPPLERGQFAAELSISSAMADTQDVGEGEYGTWFTNHMLNGRIAGGAGPLEIGAAFAYGNGHLSTGPGRGLDPLDVTDRHTVSATPYLRIAPEVSDRVDVWFTTGAHIGAVSWSRRVIGTVTTSVDGPFFDDIDVTETMTDETFIGTRASVRPHAAVGVGSAVAPSVWMGGGASFETYERVIGVQNVRGTCVSQLGESCADEALGQAQLFEQQPAASVFFDVAWLLDNLSVVGEVFSTMPLSADAPVRLPLGARLSLVALAGKARQTR